MHREESKIELRGSGKLPNDFKRRARLTASWFLRYYEARQSRAQVRLRGAKNKNMSADQKAGRRELFTASQAVKREAQNHIFFLSGFLLVPNSVQMQH